MAEALGGNPAYAASFVYPIGQLTVVTAMLFVAVLIAGVLGTPPIPSASQRPARLATAGAVLLWGLPTAAAVARLAGARIDGFMLVTYQILLVAILTAIAIDNRYRLSRTAIVTSLCRPRRRQVAVPARRARRGAR